MVSGFPIIKYYISVVAFDTKYEMPNLAAFNSRFQFSALILASTLTHSSLADSIDSKGLLAKEKVVGNEPVYLYTVSFVNSGKIIH